jgi:transitional endoplasmic reticulum ATPase
VKKNKITLYLMNQAIAFRIENYQPSAPQVKIDAQTNFTIKEAISGEEKKITYSDLGGLDDVIVKIREMVELPLRYPQIFEQLGVTPPKGILLYGPPGTGKTLLARAVANETSAFFIPVSGPQLVSKFAGGTEENFRNVFQEARDNAPSIIFFDEIDSIAGKRTETYNSSEKNIITTLLTEMDGMSGKESIVFIGATNLPDAIDPAIRRPGRFDREIEIGVPDKKARLDILKIHTRGMPLSKDVALDDLAERTPGFVGADLGLLAKEAGLQAVRRAFPSFQLAQGITEEQITRLNVTKADFEVALHEVHPSGMRELLIQRPTTTWDDIAGLGEVKLTLKEMVEWPLNYYQVYNHFNVEVPRGIILYGPPGNGKTLLVKALANMSNANFISVKGPEFMSKWVGESEKMVRETFRKAKSMAPSIIFFDEIDSLVPTRGNSISGAGVSENVVAQMLTEIDGIESLKDVVIVGATNRLDLVDPALLRPGRFDRQIYIGNPDLSTIREILEKTTHGKPLADDVNLDEIAEELNRISQKIKQNTGSGLSGADITGVIKEASMLALRETVVGLDQGTLSPQNVESATIELQHINQTINIMVQRIKNLENSG